MGAAQTVTLLFSWFFIIAVALPFVRNDHWIFRIFEYPRFQKFIGALVVLAAGAFVLDWKENLFASITLLLLTAAVLYLAYKIFPYTVLQKKEMLKVRPENVQQQLKIFTANVFQENTDYSRMLQQIKSVDADIVFLLETNNSWSTAVQQLDSEYKYSLKNPLENTYGLLFFSRFPIKQGEIKFLADREIPSIEAVIELPSGQSVKIFGLHPKPPVPQEDQTSTAKDKELMKVAFKAKECKLPVIVMGDLNDVAWSHVTELFRKNSGLLDPRRGRGFYSTFSAFNPIMRFPLDYVFCSSHFGLIEMKRMPKNGSDHFAMYSHFELQEALTHIQEEPEADAKEAEEGKEKINTNA